MKLQLGWRFCDHIAIDILIQETGGIRVILVSTYEKNIKSASQLVYYSVLLQRVKRDNSRSVKTLTIIEFWSDSDNGIVNSWVAKNFITTFQA